MKNSLVKILALMIFTVVSLPVFAQVGIAVSLNRNNFMRYEHVYACVTLRNDSGRPLLFGARPELQGYVLFDIRDSRNRPVPRMAGKEISVNGLYLAPGEVKRMVIPVSKYYNLATPGNYQIHAYVGHNALPGEFRSKDQLFNVSAGVEVWKQRVGLPDIHSERSTFSKERIYSIRVMRDGNFRSYYLQVEDADNILAVTKIGNEVSYEKFQAEVDMLNRLHLLMPVAPRVFHYMSFNISGMSLANSYWKSSGTVPMLYREPKTGKVTRIGGVEARKGIDYKDPREGLLSVDQLQDIPDNRNVPEAPAAEGVIDLGENVLPTKAADEK